MLMHISMTRGQHRAVEHWNFRVDTPWYIVVDAAEADFEAEVAWFF